MLRSAVLANKGGVVKAKPVLFVNTQRSLHIMAEQSGRLPLFRFRYPFWTATRVPPPPPPVTPSRDAVAAQQPASQNQPTPASSQPPPPATTPRNVAQQAASQSQPPPNPVVPQFPFSSSSISAQAELVPANESSSTSSYKDVSNQSYGNGSTQTQPMSKTSAMTSINLNTNQEAPRNSSPAKKERETTPHSSTASVVAPEPVTKQESEVEKREVTKEVVDHNGKNTTAGEKKEQKVEKEADIEAVDMVPTPTEYRTFQPGAAAEQMTETDIQEKQEVPSDHKSRPTGMVEERSNSISTDQYSEANHTRKRDSSFGEKNGLQWTTNLDTSNVSHQRLQYSSSETRMQQPLNLITLAGQNNGATMNITSEEETKDGPVAIHGGYKLNEDRKEDMEANNVESKNQSNKRKSEAMEMSTGTFANSNSQSINNSIFHNSSCSEGSPGVHIEFFKGLPAQVDNLKKQEQNSDLRIQQPTSETRIRRRCLRSLFMDSDSDVESLHKPRRHGCRYNCKAFGKAQDKIADDPNRDQDDVQSNVEK